LGRKYFFREILRKSLQTISDSAIIDAGVNPAGGKMIESNSMQEIEYTQLIITCEACGNVKRFTVASQDECERIFREFHCENSCGRNLYSFITLGTLHVEFEPQPEEATTENFSPVAEDEPSASATGK
jgi:hypothetical protein